MALAGAHDFQVGAPAFFQAMDCPRVLMRSERTHHLQVNSALPM
jgi:hypothetical protein